MYAILLNNAHINFERTGEKNTRELQRVKDIEIEVHKKLEKMKNLNSDSCYDFSDYSDSSSQTRSYQSQHSQYAWCDSSSKRKYQWKSQQHCDYKRRSFEFIRSLIIDAEIK